MTAAATVPDPPTAFQPSDVPSPTPSGRPSWSSLLQLHLVGIPLKAFPAVRQREAPTFHQLHTDCGQRIRCPKQCPVHGPVDAAAVVRAYEYGPGRHVVLEADELDSLRPAQDRALRLERFVTPGGCDPLLYGGRSLYLLPDGAAAVQAYEGPPASCRSRHPHGRPVSILVLLDAGPRHRADCAATRASILFRSLFSWMLAPGRQSGRVRSGCGGVSILVLLDAGPRRP